MEKQKSKNLTYNNSIQALLAMNRQSWIRSFSSGLSQDENGNFIPWMTYEAIKNLKEILTTKDSIFEFGCGTSTIFFAQNTKLVISIETNRNWFEIICKKIRTLKLTKIEFKISDSFKKLYDDIFIYGNVIILLLENGQNNNLYQKTVNQFNKKFDYVIIDSLKRLECCHESISNIKDNGIIILDDSQRNSYKKIYDFFNKNGYKFTEFWGIAPGQIKIKNTTFFKK